MKLAIMGYGTIGSGVAEVLKLNHEQIVKKVGEEIELKYILDIRESIPENEDKLVHDFSIISNDPEVELVVETMGGIHPAYEFIKECLEKGKHVVTSNKAVVDAFGSKLIRTARDKGRNFYFEASVGGGIPVIRTIYHNYAGELLTEITGILNGTTNYILTEMRENGTGFDETLKEAQRLGYAERDPSADIDGFDTSRKTAILLSMASGNRCRHEDIYTEGIRNVSDIDISYAKSLGMNIKLIGSIKNVDDRFYAYVAPVLIGKDDPLYPVDGVFNGIRIDGNCLGTTMLYGMGAGKLPTASAVVSDIIAAVRHRDHFQGIGWSEKMIEIEPMGRNIFRYLLRVEGKPGGIEEELAAFFLIDGNGRIEEDSTEDRVFEEVMPGGIRSKYEGEKVDEMILFPQNSYDYEFGLLSVPMSEESFHKRRKEFEEKTGRRIFQFLRARV